MKEKEEWFHFRCDAQTKQQFDYLLCDTKLTRSELFKKMLECYLKFGSEEIDDINNKLDMILEFVQIPVKCYGTFPRDILEIERIVNARSRYELVVQKKLQSNKLLTR